MALLRMWGFQSHAGAFALVLLVCQEAVSGASDQLYQCHSDLSLGPVSKATQKGLAVDDTTWRWCSDAIPSLWPNADEPVTSIRLFKAWHAEWQDDRDLAWQNLKNFVTSTGAKVLLGVSISCKAEEDEQDWTWVKQLAQLLGKDHVMGLAIGNELELLFTKTAFSEDIDADCVHDLWDAGRFWRRFTEIVQEFDDLGFRTVPVTSVFGGLALAGNSTHPFFEKPGKALVNSFFTNATQRYGDRYAWTWNTYPYFDPNEKLDIGSSDSCELARNRSLCFGIECDAPKSMAYYRKKMAMLTGKTGSTLWIGETGWSSKGSVNSDMKYCKNWAAPESLQSYYQSFLAWDLNVPKEEPPDHVFYFSIRDALNFGNQEHFGIIEQCFMPQCKLHTEDFVPPESPLPNHWGCYYQQPTEGNGNCDGPWKFWKIDEWGMRERGSGENEANCMARKSGHDSYCGTDTKWLFIPAETTTEAGSGSTGSSTAAARTSSSTTSTTSYTMATTSTTTMTTSELATTASTSAAQVPSTATTTTLPTALSGFSPAVSGSAENSVCRGASKSDNSAEYYRLFGGIAKLDECKALCVNLPGCVGIEFHPRGRCEAWTRPDGIQATAKASDYLCLRYSQATGSTTTTTLPDFWDADGGENRACRGATSTDNAKKHYKIFTGSPSLEACKALCVAEPSCVGIEFKKFGRRCEVWTRPQGIGATAEVLGFHCLRYLRGSPALLEAAIDSKVPRKKVVKTDRFLAPDTSIGNAFTQAGTTLGRFHGPSSFVCENQSTPVFSETMSEISM